MFIIYQLCSSFAVAVTSDFGILFFDPRQKEISPFHKIPNAHNNFVNIISFVDEHTFLTASGEFLRRSNKFR